MFANVKQEIQGENWHLLTYYMDTLETFVCKNQFLHNLMNSVHKILCDLINKF